MKKLFPIFCLLIAIFCGACQPESQPQSDLYLTRVANDGQDTLTLYRGELPNVVRTHLLSEPKTIHPIVQGDAKRALVLQHTHQSLQTQDMETSELIPLLARMVERSDDGLSYTYELLAGTAWPDGAPLTVDDVAFTLKMMLCPHVSNPALHPYLAYVSDLETAPDAPRRFTVRMSDYFMSNELFGVYFLILDPRRFDPEGVLAPYSVADLADPESEANQSEAVQAWGAKLSAPAIGKDLQYLQGGSGPYQIEAWEEGNVLRLVRNNHYWAADRREPQYQQKPEGIEFRFVRDEQTLELLVKQQELDVSTSFNGETFDRLRGSDLVQQHYHLTTVPDQSLALIALNNQPQTGNRSPVFEQQAVRQAVAHALDVDGMLEDVLNGYGSPATSPVWPGNAHYQAQPRLRYDPDQARRLLDEAGWQDTDQDGVRDREIEGQQVPLRFELSYPPNGRTLEEFANRIERELSAVGFEVLLRPAVKGEFSTNLVKGNYDAALLSFAKNPNPYDFHQLFHSSNYPGGYNFFGYVNAGVDSLIDRMRIEPDAAERRRLAEVIQAQIYQDQPAIFLYYITKKMVVHRRFSDPKIYRNDPFILLNTLEVIRPES